MAGDERRAIARWIGGERVGGERSGGRQRWWFGRGRTGGKRGRGSRAATINRLIEILNSCLEQGLEEGG